MDSGQLLAGRQIMHTITCTHNRIKADVETRHTKTRL